MHGNIEDKSVEKAIDGDADAFNEVSLRLRDTVYNFACRMLGSTPAAEDITQETFMFLIERPEKYQPERGSSLSVFLCGVARNKIMHHLRRSGRHSEISTDTDDDYIEPKDENGQDPLEILLDRELALKVEESVAALPPSQREAIILRDLQEFSYEEIAEICGGNINTVKSRVHRARLSLARRMERYKAAGRKNCHEMY